MTSPSPTKALPDWGTATPSGPPRAPLILLGMGLAGVLLALGLGFPTAAILISVGLLVAGLSIRIRGARLLRNEDAEPLDPVRDPRLANLVEGLVARLGVSAPAVWVSPGEVPNAAAVWRGGPQLLLRRGLLGAFSRTELEAVVAFLLVVHATGEARRAAWRFGEAGPGSSVVGALDVAAVAVTRYPPAYSSALRKAVGEGASGGAVWFVPSGAEATADARASAVADL